MNRQRMRGMYTVEFAIIGLLLFTLLFGVLEMGRLYFTVNALNEVVRRGARLAAVCDIRDMVILHRAIFNAATDSGPSDLIATLTPAHLTLSYMDENGATVTNPDDIGYVQMRVENFPFELLIPGFHGVFNLPTFRSTIPRESLGRHAEEPQPFDQPPESGITPC